MGVKTRIEQSIKRARREGRLEDAADFEQDLIALKAQRSQAAMERGHSYTVQPGDSYFSIAQEQLGDERWAKSLVQANPALTHLRPGMVIVIPKGKGAAPSFGEQEYDDFVYKYGMEPDLLMEPESEEQSQEAVATEAADQTQPEQAEQPETAPGAMSPEEEDALVDELVVLFEALEQQGAGQLPGKQKMPTPTGTTPPAQSAKQKTTGQKAAAGKATPTSPPPPTGTPEPDTEQQGEEYSTWEDRKRQEAREKQDSSDVSDSELIDSDSQNGTQYDLTEWLVEDMVASASKEFALPSMLWLDQLSTGPNADPEFASEYFALMMERIPKAIELFSSGHLKDVKIQIENKLDQAVVLCGKDECRWLENSVPGNILFGFNMAASGILGPIFRGGAGWAQIQDDERVTLEWAPYFDNPKDMAAIDFGVYLFDTYKYDLNVADFKRELTSGILDSFQQVPEGYPLPHNPYAEENHYPPGFFDNKP